MHLRATKSLTYNTRRLLPGDEFEATSRHGRILVAARKAVEVRPPTDVPAPPPALAEKIAEQFPEPADLAAVRAEYETVMGKRPFHGWDAATLREKIEAARVG